MFVTWVNTSQTKSRLSPYSVIPVNINSHSGYKLLSVFPGSRQISTNIHEIYTVCLENKYENYKFSVLKKLLVHWRTKICKKRKYDPE
jgi:hypothetical protein